MKKIPFILFIFLGIFSSCLKETNDYTSLRITAPRPESLPTLDMKLLTVNLINKRQNITYRLPFDSSGVAEFMVEPGIYQINISGKTPYDEDTAFVNGGSSEFMLTQQGIIDANGGYRPAVIAIPLDVAAPAALVIREVFYGGSRTPEGANYNKEFYVEIYNNGISTTYLDSLFVGAIAPYNSSIAVNRWAGMDTIAAIPMQWMVPGNGSDYPLEPGQSAVFALNAIDHTGRSTMSLRLDKADFALYHPTLSMQEKSSEVTSMVYVTPGQGNAYAMSFSSPAVVIYRIPNVQSYLANILLWERYEPGKTSGIKYWHMPKEWILDGVEIVVSEGDATKRLPNSIDASYIYPKQGRNNGNCVRRKVKKVLSNGQEVFMDTNNSANDFEADVRAEPRLKN